MKSEHIKSEVREYINRIEETMDSLNRYFCSASGTLCRLEDDVLQLRDRLFMLEEKSND